MHKFKTAVNGETTATVNYVEAVDPIRDWNSIRFHHSCDPADYRAERLAEDKTPAVDLRNCDPWGYMVSSDAQGVTLYFRDRGTGDLLVLQYNLIDNDEKRYFMDGGMKLNTNFIIAVAVVPSGQWDDVTSATLEELAAIRKEAAEKEAYYGELFHGEEQGR